MDELDIKVQAYISGNDEEEKPELSTEEIRDNLIREINENQSGWTQDTVGFSLNEMRFG